MSPKAYCQQCGDDLYQGHVCNPQSLETMRKNPFLRLLMNDDGTANWNAPVILGGGDDTPTVRWPEKGR